MPTVPFRSRPPGIESSIRTITARPSVQSFRDRPVDLSFPSPERRLPALVRPDSKECGSARKPSERQRVISPSRLAGAWRFDGVRRHPVPFGEAHPENRAVTRKKDGRWTGHSSLAVLDGGVIAVSGMVGHRALVCPRELLVMAESPYQLR
ncbi:hypothetical protein GCM10010439_05780 [Actinocorallia aurantiaca]|uniref:Uncharacterized protein n=1 Tax=Actinocorallia aurantiaca TaxID=46204 RepID=A0ABN3TX14_9ACTN